MSSSDQDPIERARQEGYRSAIEDFAELGDKMLGAVIVIVFSIIIPIMFLAGWIWSLFH